MQDTTQVQATHSNTQQAGCGLGSPVTAVCGTQHQLMSAGSAAAGVQSGCCPARLLPVLCATAEAAVCAETGEQQARGSGHASGVHFVPIVPNNYQLLLCDMAELYRLVTAGVAGRARQVSNRLGAQAMHAGSCLPRQCQTIIESCRVSWQRYHVVTAGAAACAGTGERQAGGSSHACGVLFAPAAPNNYRVLLCVMAEVYHLVTARPVACSETGDQQAQGSDHAPRSCLPL